MSNYTLNAEAAKQADQIGGRITESGKYTGTITRAEEITSKKGTLGVEFAFKADNGQSADYLTVWTKNKDGKELFGLKHLMAMMTVCRLRGISAVPGEVEKYDFDSGQVRKMKATVFPEFVGKRIGFLLQKEDFQKSDGTIGSKMVIFNAFDADSDFTASEILDRATTPAALSRMELMLRDKPIKPGAGGDTYGSASDAPAAAGGFDLGDDDIPF